MDKTEISFRDLILTLHEITKPREYYCQRDTIHDIADLWQFRENRREMEDLAPMIVKDWHVRDNGTKLTAKDGIDPEDAKHYDETYRITWFPGQKWSIKKIR